MSINIRYESMLLFSVIYYIYLLSRTTTIWINIMQTHSKLNIMCAYRCYCFVYFDKTKRHFFLLYIFFFHNLFEAYCTNMVYRCGSGDKQLHYILWWVVILLIDIVFKYYEYPLFRRIFSHCFFSHKFIVHFIYLPDVWNSVVNRLKLRLRCEMKTVMNVFQAFFCFARIVYAVDKR